VKIGVGFGMNVVLRIMAVFQTDFSTDAKVSAVAPPFWLFSNLIGCMEFKALLTGDITSKKQQTPCFYVTIFRQSK
jgi:hypothetical protein